MKKFFVFLILGLLVLGTIGMALSQTGKVKDYGKSKEKITIYENATKNNKLAEYTLLSNECDEGFRFCNATIETKFYKDDEKIIDSIDIFRVVNDSLNPGKVRWMEIYYYTLGEKINVNDYGWECLDDKNKNKNETVIYTEYPYNLDNSTNETLNCSYKIIGTHKEDAPEWTLYNNQTFKNNDVKKLLIKAEKRPSWKLDWIAKVFDEISLSEWATWGNISTGDDAEVLILSPENNSYVFENNAAISCFANITNGANIVNISVFNISDGFYNLLSSDSFGYSITNNTEVTSFGCFGASEKNISVGFTIDKITSEIKTSGGVSSQNIFRWTFEYENGTSANVDLSDSTTSYVETTFNNPYPNEVVRNILFNFCPYDIQPYERNSFIYPINNQNDPFNFSFSITNDTDITCQACDSDGVCGYSGENRTIPYNSGPAYSIISPSLSVTSSGITINFSATALGLNNVSTCTYNITRGASTEVAETNILEFNNSGYYNDTQTLSSEASYVLNIDCNDSQNVFSTDSLAFTYAIPPVVIPPAGGGSSTTIIVGGETGWSMETTSGQASYEISQPKGTSRELSVNFENLGSDSVNIKLSCEDVNSTGGCNFVNFKESEFSLPLILDVKTTKFFTVTVPEDSVDGDYTFNIVATDDNDQRGIITVYLSVGTKSPIVDIFSKLRLNTEGGFPYFAIFFLIFVSFLIVGGLIVPKFDLKGLVLGISGLIVSGVAIYFI